MSVVGKYPKKGPCNEKYIYEIVQIVCLYFTKDRFCNADGCVHIVLIWIADNEIHATRHSKALIVLKKFGLHENFYSFLHKKMPLFCLQLFVHLFQLKCFTINVISKNSYSYLRKLGQSITPYS